MDRARSAFDAWGMATREELLAVGVPGWLIDRRVREGRWARRAPRIITSTTGDLPPDAVRRLALRAMPQAVLSHESAAVVHGLRIVEAEVHVTVRHSTSRTRIDGVVVHQSARAPGPARRRGYPVTGVARTVVDVALGLDRLREVRALVAEAVQRGLTTPQRLCAELDNAPRRGRAHVAAALAEVASGARSAPEAEFVQQLRGSGLPMPELNVRLVLRGETVVVDALWRHSQLVAEIDSREWHLGPDQWAADLRRQNLLVAEGYTVLRFTVRQLRDQPERMLADVRAALAAAPRW